jgi:outer membrane protein TolC
MTTPTRPATARADATDADIALYRETSAVLQAAKADLITAQAAKRAAEAAHYPTIRAVFYKGD